MDEEQKRIYLVGNGLLCPYCGSEDIETKGFLRIEDDQIVQDACCFACHRKWTDHYKLTDVTTR